MSSEIACQLVRTQASLLWLCQQSCAPNTSIPVWMQASRVWLCQASCALNTNLLQEHRQTTCDFVKHHALLTLACYKNTGKPLVTLSRIMCFKHSILHGQHLQKQTIKPRLDTELHEVGTSCNLVSSLGLIVCFCRCEQRAKNWKPGCIQYINKPPLWPNIQPGRGSQVVRTKQATLCWDSHGRHVAARVKLVVVVCSGCSLLVHDRRREQNLFTLIFCGLVVFAIKLCFLPPVLFNSVDCCLFVKIFGVSHTTTLCGEVYDINLCVCVWKQDVRTKLYFTKPTLQQLPINQALNPSDSRLVLCMLRWLCNVAETVRVATGVTQLQLGMALKEKWSPFEVSSHTPPKRALLDCYTANNVEWMLLLCAVDVSWLSSFVCLFFWQVM